MSRPPIPESQRRIHLSARVAPETRAKLAALETLGLSLGEAIDQVAQSADDAETGIYSRQGEWSGYTVRRTAAGWVYAAKSRVQGERDGYQALVRPNPVRWLPADIPLGDQWNEHMEVGEYIAMLASECPDKVLRRGAKVQ